MRLRALLPITLLTLVQLTESASAQPSQAQIAAAKKAAAEAADAALDAYNDGKYEAAVKGFRDADKAFHAPKFLLYVARSQEKMGKLTEARKTYEAIIGEKLPAYAPAEFFQAQVDAKKELKALSPRIPTISITAKGGIESASLDGKGVPLGEPIPTDPGKHTIKGHGTGVVDAETEISIEERETKDIVLEGTPVPAVTASASTGPVEPSKGSFLSSIPLPTYVAYGAGALGLVLGGVFSGLTVAKQGDYEALRNASPVNPADVNAAASEGRAFAAVTDVGFLVAILGAATGTVWWIVAPKPKEAAEDGQNTSSLKEHRLRPSVFVSPQAGGISVFGSF